MTEFTQERRNEAKAESARLIKLGSMSRQVSDTASITTLALTDLPAALDALDEKDKEIAELKAENKEMEEYLRDIGEDL